MDCVAAAKAEEILRAFKSLPLRGRLLDVGAGSGALAAAFLKQHPALSATLFDLPEVLVQTRRLQEKIRAKRDGTFVEPEVRPETVGLRNPSIARFGDPARDPALDLAQLDAVLDLDPGGGMRRKKA